MRGFLRTARSLIGMVCALLTSQVARTFIGFLVAGLFLSAVVVWLLWNWLCPELFGLPTVTFWQSFGLLFLCRCLFAGTK